MYTRACACVQVHGCSGIGYASPCTIVHDHLGWHPSPDPKRTKSERPYAGAACGAGWRWGADGAELRRHWRRRPERPDLTVIERLAAALDVTAEFLLYGTTQAHEEVTLDLDLVPPDDLARITHYLGTPPTTEELRWATEKTSYHRGDWKRAAKMIELRRGE